MSWKRHPHPRQRQASLALWIRPAVGGGVPEGTERQGEPGSHEVWEPLRWSQRCLGGPHVRVGRGYAQSGPDRKGLGRLVQVCRFCLGLDGQAWEPLQDHPPGVASAGHLGAPHGSFQNWDPGVPLVHWDPSSSPGGPAPASQELGAACRLGGGGAGGQGRWAAWGGGFPALWPPVPFGGDVPGFWGGRKGAAEGWGVE